MEKMNNFSLEYSRGRIATLKSQRNNLNLSMGQVFKKISDITLDELMVCAGMNIDPNGSDDPNTEAFKSSQKTTVQHWIDFSYGEAPDVAERLDRELNPEDLKN